MVRIKQKIFGIWPNISEKKDPPIDNEKYKNEENKFEKYLKKPLKRIN